MTVPRSPLSVFVVWHDAFADGARLAEHLFRQLCGDPASPSSRSLGIPVSFRTRREGVPQPIPFDEADRTVVVVLVDDEMVAGTGWDAYCDGLLDAARPDVDLVIPVQLSESAFNLSDRFEQINFARLPGQDVLLELSSKVVHDLCVVLAPTQKVTVFISHAKVDGLDLAKQLQTFLHQDAGIADFFDATNIPDGSTFGSVIHEGVRDASLLLIVQTDSYASREWCRLEVLGAKEHRVPILVLAAVNEGEVRSFPYIGNVPVVRWTEAAPTGRLVYALLREVLRKRWFPLHYEMLASAMGSVRHGVVLIYPPELLTVLLMSATEDGGAAVRRCVYPDPPLGKEELELLRRLDPTLDAMTPTQVLAR